MSRLSKLLRSKQSNIALYNNLSSCQFYFLMKCKTNDISCPIWLSALQSSINNEAIYIMEENIYSLSKPLPLPAAFITISKQSTVSTFFILFLINFPLQITHSVYAHVNLYRFNAYRLYHTLILLTGEDHLQARKVGRYTGCPGHWHSSHERVRLHLFQNAQDQFTSY